MSTFKVYLFRHIDAKHITTIEVYAAPMPGDVIQRDGYIYDVVSRVFVEPTFDEGTHQTLGVLVRRK